MKDNGEKKTSSADNTKSGARNMNPDIRRAFEKTRERYDQAFRNLRDR